MGVEGWVWVRREVGGGWESSLGGWRVGAVVQELARWFGDWLGGGTIGSVAQELTRWFDSQLGDWTITSVARELARGVENMGGGLENWPVG